MSRSAPVTGIAAVFMPAREQGATRRTGLASARSLDEADMPTRTGTTAAARCRDIAGIVAYLDVEAAAHRRYQPRDGLTFCNIYAHDLCHLAGVYLPRVWWTDAAADALVAGQPVTPALGRTIREMRANDLLRWLATFGPVFGWQRVDTLTALQDDANRGSVGLVIARKQHDGRPGHVAIVVAESGAHTARRNSAGEVTLPLQSQAGRTNFKGATGQHEWWREASFAEHAFWVHP